MSNDGWGKMPTIDDNWTAPANGSTASNSSAWSDGWPAPAGSDSWQTSPPLAPSAACAPAVSDGWGEFGSGTTWPLAAGGNKYLKETAPDALRQDAEYAEREKQWTHNALDSANTRASVINSLNGRKDEYTIDQDGELSNIKETVSAKKPGEPTGWYLAYSNGKWLHAILSGPYSTTQEALLRSETVWNKFTNDGAFQLAFDNKFNRDGIYCAEIPLSLKRHGAYGVLT